MICRDRYNSFIMASEGGKRGTARDGVIEGCRPRGAACHKETNPTDNGANPSVSRSLCLSLVINRRALPSIRWDVVPEKVAGGECKERNWRMSRFCATVLLQKK